MHERDDAINAVVTAPVRRLLQHRLLAQDVVQELLKHARTDALILCVLALKLHGDPLEQIDHMAALAHVDAEAASGQQRIDHVRHAIAGAVHPIHRAILSVVIGVAMRRMRRNHHHLPRNGLKGRSLDLKEAPSLLYVENLTVQPALRALHRIVGSVRRSILLVAAADRQKEDILLLQTVARPDIRDPTRNMNHTASSVAFILLPGARPSGACVTVALKQTVAGRPPCLS